MAQREIIAIGGSAGSITPIREICSALPADLRAAVLIAVHVQANGRNLLAGILDNEGPIPAATAVDGQAWEPGRIYVAPMDYHLLVENRVLRLGRGPRENMARPAIDPLFRSVGLAAGPRAIGVLMSGMLNDGAAGLADLKRCGGVTVVQSPLDAKEAEMPQTALLASDIDYRAPARDMTDLLVRLLQEQAGAAPVPPPRIALEMSIAMGRATNSAIMAEIADPSPLTCPACGGVLSEIRTSPLRFRCQVGHGYTAEALNHVHAQGADEAIRVALRVLGERIVVMDKMTFEALQAGRTGAAASFEIRAKEYRRHAAVLTAAALHA